MNSGCPALGDYPHELKIKRSVARKGYRYCTIEYDADGSSDGGDNDDDSYMMILVTVMTMMKIMMMINDDNDTSYHTILQNSTRYYTHGHVYMHTCIYAYM